MDQFLKGLNKDIEWLKDRTVLMVRHGSHAYGTNTAGSDEDFRGIAIPPSEYFFGFLKSFENLVRNDPDVTIFDIRKFFKLAIENNPNVLEILFVDPSDIISASPLGEELLAIRDQFISRAAKERFLGYAKAQAHRIKTHRRWILNPPAAPPSRTDFGLTEKMEIPKDQLLVVWSQMQKKVDEWRPDFEPFSEPQQIYLQNKVANVLAEMEITSSTEWMCAARTLGYSENFIQLLQKEKEFEGRKADWGHYQQWLNNRNEKRAELERKYLYDTKHGAHLVRLLRMGREILTQGKVIVRRPDAAELLEIRNGKWTYEQLIEHAEMIEKEIEAAYFTSPVQVRPNRNKLDELCQSIIERSLRTEKA